VTRIVESARSEEERSFRIVNASCVRCRALRSQGREDVREDRGCILLTVSRRAKCWPTMSGIWRFEQLVRRYNVQFPAASGRCDICAESLGVYELLADNVSHLRAFHLGTNACERSNSPYTADVKLPCSDISASRSLWAARTTGALSPWSRATMRRSCGRIRKTGRLHGRR
jgi:hypothetical protein